MSRWKIFSDAGDNSFRWGICGRIVRPESDYGPTRNIESGLPLPSMADLLLQGCSKLLERGDEGAGKLPMFTTGLGKPVVLKESSMAKALSVLGDDDPADSHDVFQSNDAFSLSNSLFQTGSGKMVNISSAGLVRAKKLLGLEEDNVRSDLYVQGATMLPFSNEQYGCEKSLNLDTKEGVDNSRVMDAMSITRPTTGLVESSLNNEVSSTLIQYEILSSSAKVPPVKFHTAGGRSLSVSSDALKRAKSLLGDPDLGSSFDETDANDPSFMFSKDRRLGCAPSKKENDIYSSISHQGTAKSKNKSNSFTSPLQSSSKQLRSLVNSENIAFGSNLIKKFDEVGNESVYGLNVNESIIQEPLNNSPSAPNSVVNNSSGKGVGSRINQFGSPFAGPLADISNCIGTNYKDNKQTTSVKRKLGRTSSVSPFKRPRSTKFSTPLKENVSIIPSGLSTLSSDRSCSRRVVSTRFPFQIPRMNVNKYFGGPPSAQSKSEHWPERVREIKSDNADKYVFTDEAGSIGAEAFFHMLVQSGASTQHVSKEWVQNHYKWIVWKLASYERCYPAKAMGKFLTVSNVLEELKYRYEREVNHGHGSAIKRILDGDASASSMMVLCISAIHLNCESKIGIQSMATNGPDTSNIAKVEVTDGWYSMDALLDISLSKRLAAGKLFVGQKLRVSGAGLYGWVGPISPIEASKTVSLLLNINGTYRAHWDDQLGFCKSAGAPLAFRCIKSDGGPVPSTLVGLTRIYPVLYKERLKNGKSIVRSERMEIQMRQLHNQRRSVVVEGIVSEYQKGVNDFPIHDETDNEEGARILKILETAAEPEVLMAEMSPEQLASFAAYKAKLEATRLTEMEKSIQRALEDDGLSDREVTPFMRLRVTGLTTRNYQGKASPKEGIITIWNPIEMQQNELVEGHIYNIKGLVPTNSDSGTLYLQARGSTTQLQPLPPEAIQHFNPFFNPRKSVLISELGEVPLSSEFDIAAFVVYVGEVYVDALQRKQWVFVTESSISDLQSREISNSLLAISFCSPYIDDVSFTQINHNLGGSTVGFCNLIKRAKDQKNELWVAEATENSTYFLSFNQPHCSHLKSAAASAKRWTETSSLAIDKLREKVLFIIGDCKD